MKRSEPEKELQSQEPLPNPYDEVQEEPVYQEWMRRLSYAAVIAIGLAASVITIAQYLGWI